MSGRGLAELVRNSLGAKSAWAIEHEQSAKVIGHVAEVRVECDRRFVGDLIVSFAHVARFGGGVEAVVIDPAASNHRGGYTKRGDGEDGERAKRAGALHGVNSLIWGNDMYATEAGRSIGKLAGGADWPSRALFLG